MFVCKIENTKNNILRLTQNESDFQILSVQGLNPPNAQINTSKIVGLDGSKFNSSMMNERNLVVMVKLRGDIEKNRIRLYSFFRSKEWCKFYYKNNSRDVYIEGYVESVECDLFSNKEIMQISIICPNPYFKGVEEIIDDISKSVGVFEFPFAINLPGVEFSTTDNSKITNVFNDSESETGVIITIDVLSNVSTIQIKDTSSGEIFTLDYDFVENDRITIDTNKGKKSVSLLRNATNINLFSAVKKGSTFFQLDIGDNFFSYLVDDGTNDGAVQISFKHYAMYGGV